MEKKEKEINKTHKTLRIYIYNYNLFILNNLIFIKIIKYLKVKSLDDHLLN